MRRRYHRYRGEHRAGARDEHGAETEPDDESGSFAVQLRHSDTRERTGYELAKRGDAQSDAYERQECDTDVAEQVEWQVQQAEYLGTGEG